MSTTAARSQLTIEQLAAASGMSVRNIRAHQARGLLDPPEVRRRLGWYHAGHVARLALIAELQADGFNLAGIKRLLDEARGDGDRVARIRAAIADGADDEIPATLTRSELARRFRVPSHEAEAVLERAQRLGILRSSGPDRFLAPSPALLRMAARAAERGVSLDGALAAVEATERHCDAIAETFVALFMEQVWAPYEAAGMPDARWVEIDGAIAALRPLASEALQTIFAQRMQARLEGAVGELARRLDEQ